LRIASIVTILRVRAASAGAGREARENQSVVPRFLLLNADRR
jgi:hypothetical protein